MIMPSRQVWFWTAAAAVLFVTVLTFVVSRSGACNDDYPALDERVGKQGRELGEAKERAASGAGPADLAELRERRSRFAADSEAQLVALAAEIERHSSLTATSMERLEQLRRDHMHLREQRQRVIDSSDAEFDENLLQFETHVNTVREQLSRLDEGKLP